MIWIIGAGNMGQEYAKVLKAQEKEFLVIGRGEKNTELCRDKYDCKVVSGGLENFLKESPACPENAIVGVNVEFLYPMTALLLEYGVKNILLEKPGGLNREEISKISDLSKEKDARVLIAYNRRFYKATELARDFIQRDGGVKSFNFEFTEWSHRIGVLPKSKETFESWLLANSSHVIDLAFHLGGFPKVMHSHSSGSNVIDWHPKASIFSGSGISDDGALFNYQANWAAPGRWSVEVLTKNHRLIFRPMEELHIQKIGSVAIEKVESDYSLDQDFKPGLYKQLESFLSNKDESFISIESQLNHIGLYEQILNGS